MQALLDRYVNIEALRSISYVTTGYVPTDEFHGDKLTVSTARLISECMNLPGVNGLRFVACSYFEVTPKAFDVFLLPLEESTCRFIFSSETPAPETFSSRLSPLSSGAPSLSQLYMSFALPESDKSGRFHLLGKNVLDPAALEFWRDRYMQSLGPVSQFVASVADGNHESALRASLGFRAEDLELLVVDLEWQLEGKTVSGVSLSRVSTDHILSALNVVSAKSQAAVSTKAASAAFLLSQ